MKNMKTHFKYSDSVERYLSNEMVQDERELFIKDVLTNSELSQELKFSRTIDAALRQDDIIDLRMKLQAAQKEKKISKPEVPVIRLQVKKFWYAAASIILLAAIGSTLFFNMPGGSSSDRLFSEYYSPDNLVNVTRSGDANIVEAVLKFQEQDYVVASKLFKQILVNDQANYAGWFYYGITCIETESFDQAEEAFNKIITDNQNLYVEHAEWYLGLSYLKNNKIDKARVQLSIVASNGDNIHRNEARQILEKLSD